MAESDQPDSGPIGYRLIGECMGCGIEKATRVDCGYCRECIELDRDAEAQANGDLDYFELKRQLRNKIHGIKDSESADALGRLRRKAEGKPRLSLVNGEFLMALAEHMERGNKDGRVANDWQDLPSAEALEACKDAMLRHALGVGPEDEAGHMVAVASNAMIRWWHLTRGNNA